MTEASLEEVTYLEVNDHKEHNDCGRETGNVGGVFTEEGVLEGKNLVTLGQKRVEKGNNCAFELSVLFCLNRDWRKRFPQNDLTNVSSDEETNTVSKTIAFLKEFIEKLHNKTGKSKLEKNGDGVEDSELVHLTVHA